MLTGPANQPTNFSKDANDTVFKVLRERQPASHEFAPLLLKSCNTNHSKVGSKRRGEAPPLQMSRKTVTFLLRFHSRLPNSQLPTPNTQHLTPSLAHSLLSPALLLPAHLARVSACHKDLQSANTPPLNSTALILATTSRLVTVLGTANTSGACSKRRPADAGLLKGWTSSSS